MHDVRQLLPHEVPDGRAMSSQVGIPALSGTTLYFFSLQVVIFLKFWGLSEYSGLSYAV